MRISDWSSDVCSSDLFLNHPYRIPIIGWDHEIEQLSTEAAIRFYDKWYAPNNAVLIVVGDVDPQRVRALAEKYYGRSEEHTSALQSIMRISSAVFCLKKNNTLITATLTYCKIT